MKYLSLFLLLFLFSINTTAQKLHMISIIDVEDESIGEGCEKDRKNMKKERDRIVKYSGLEKGEYYEGIKKNFTKDFIFDSIANLEASGSDTILFYYSGHGGAADKLTFAGSLDKLPRLVVGKDYPRLSYIVELLEKKDVFSIIVIADCCNNYSFQDPKEDEIFFSLSKENVRKNYHKLFYETEGTIIATGCEPGQFSYGPVTGGAFTNAFLASLKKRAYADDTSWREVMEMAISRVLKKYKKQHPQYVLDISKHCF
ncbi:hypothetical protein UABAM_04731 [Candidatus Uabimicrobium amorphum]|uniref:Peptidase C14 caspase domain-containing protein n=1 Tax=Uabimicrobium amorphum TaxID=2596890 RepID=A0A5S9F509_UABAM|nr:caspase family protein [Candidatus Uabimicrobium amorphum]BBM86345.1 hypothetical protein UABAM_04731 [Candidatus Uabimicrobium amorphum]